MKLSSNQSLAGILEPVFAIRTAEDLGIGDTEGMRQMIDWCARHRLNILQTLPINELSDDNSPYNAISSLAIEPVTLAISPSTVPDLSPGKFAELAPPGLLGELRKGSVHYPGVRALKRKLLEAAFENFFQNNFNPLTERARQFQSFQTENQAWLEDYAMFRMLMEENGGTSAWDQWLPAHRTPESARNWLLGLPGQRLGGLKRKQLFFMYVQWLAFGQWQALKAYGTEKEVNLMGDIPFGVGRCSADVWANRALFDLDWSGGAPPERVFKVDLFTEKWGQNWGIPNYRWDELRRRNFDWWRTRVGNIQKVFHLYRIDHVLGFFRIYSFPWTPDRNAEFLPLTEAEAAEKTGGRQPGFKVFPDDTPEHKAANQSQGEEILRVVLEGSGETTVVAEDLGVVPEYVHPTLQKLGVPGFRIPMFFREKDGEYSDPKHYPRLSLAQPTTHDHPPLAAAWAECWQNIDAGKDVDNSRRELRAMMDFAGLKDVEPPREFGGQLHEGFMRAVLQSQSWLVVLQITDLFAMKARFNTPGSVAVTNWSYRLPQTVKELDKDPALLRCTGAFSRLVQESGRGG
ncbi:MAG: 4-alpha-glucanotransferase [Verrucomicrobia bacterium]|nr:4-alpha-glucanotransferase [Verrucomicrobiota bacterium]